MDNILRILNDNPRLSNAEIAAMTGITEDEVGEKIASYERNGIICGYKTVINWEKIEKTDKVTAIIELKVTPRRDTGFEAIAEEIMSFDEVESVSLMSGGYDFSVCVTGRTFQEIALFVAKRLAPLDSVTSTTTTFILKKYKEDGIILSSQNDERGADVL
ncbi:MAG: Lrp/AsnC family transcriptional regulator [Clostridia bacterium]|jgi:DNA-binding Lrp family transcriptional regulator|nr:Lrp/AsnC family transcriptional regulator [Clostridia bacterium]